MSSRIAPRLAALVVAALAAAPFAGAPAAAGAATRPAPSLADDHGHDIPRRGGSYVLASDGSRVVCREATLEEEAALRPAAREYTVVTTGKSAKQGGLRILLVADPQIRDQFPHALEAFMRAAATWESRVTTPITVAIRVDFGPKRFGETYPTGVLGSTDPQYHTTRDDQITLLGYSGVRSGLAAVASSASEASLYGALPATSVPTDEGVATSVVLPTALRRALGNLPAEADPNAAYLPSVGFNSRFTFDFDPSDGIFSNAFDFDATAVHEIGHVLGFNSFAGFRKFYGDDAPVLMTALDMFRFRPGAAGGVFGTAQRVLKTGGRQVFSDRSKEIELATGGIDGEDGDGAQSSHWKEDSEFGSYIGLMDPFAFPGERNELTDDDMLAFDTIGYRIGEVKAITFQSLEADLAGDVLTISGRARAAAGAIREVEVALVDPEGETLATLPRRAITPDASGNFSVEVDGLAAMPSAVKALVTLFGDDGAESEAAEADFGAGDAGGPAVTGFKRKGAKLRLNGSGFAAGIQIEINGVVTPLPNGSKVKASKIVVKRPNLQPGPNRVRLVLGGLRSNIVVVNS